MYTRDLHNKRRGIKQQHSADRRLICVCGSRRVCVYSQFVVVYGGGGCSPTPTDKHELYGWFIEGLPAVEGGAKVYAGTCAVAADYLAIIKVRASLPPRQRVRIPRLPPAFHRYTALQPQLSLSADTFGKHTSARKTSKRKRFKRPARPHKPLCP